MQKCKIFSSDFIILHRALLNILYKNIYTNIQYTGIIIFTNALNSVRRNVHANYFIDHISIFLCRLSDKMAKYKCIV